MNHPTITLEVYAADDVAARFREQLTGNDRDIVLAVEKLLRSRVGLHDSDPTELLQVDIQTDAVGSNGELGSRALAGLRHIYYSMDLGADPVQDEYSAADQCDAIYELMGELGMEVS